MSLLIFLPLREPDKKSSSCVVGVVCSVLEGDLRASIELNVYYGGGVDRGTFSRQTGMESGLHCTELWVCVDTVSWETGNGRNNIVFEVMDSGLMPN